MALYEFAADFSLPYNRPAKDLGDGMFRSSGCIRITPNGGLYIHSNSSHINRGLARVWISEGTGSLYIDQQVKGPVTDIQVSGDETITALKGILVGGSSGTGQTAVYFYDTKIGQRLDLSDPSDYARVAASGSNLWVAITQDLGPADPPA